ncbi:MAG TPA: tetratricopeptide repeat protein [Gemmataceae bacterium]|nr:tetratricopeptide repeat protein [Gemmataceae bacterium]
MTPRQRLLISLGAIVLAPCAAAAGWWYYWPTYRLHEAEAALAAGDLARAEQLLKELTFQKPAQARVYLLYAQAMRRSNQPLAAQRALYEATQLGLPDAERRRELALTQAAKQFSASVERNLLAVLEDNPRDEEIVRALADGYANTRRWVDADRYYSRWLELAPESLEAWLARGHARLTAVSYQYGRAEDGAADFREVLRRVPEHYEARLYLAHCLMSDARMAEAKKELLVCRQQRPDSLEPLVGLAACAVEDRNWDDAETLLKQALEREPRSTYALSMLGDLCLRRQQYERAISSFQQVLELTPGDQAAHLKLAQALRAVGKPDQAEPHERLFEQLRAQNQALRDAEGR